MGFTLRKLPLLVLVLALLCLCGMFHVVAVAAASAKSYYDLLGVPKDADERQLKSAYRKLAKKYHPDKNQDNRDAAEAKFQEMAHAYEVLMDPEKRQIYDHYGEEGLKGAPPPGSGGNGFPRGASGQRFEFNGFPGGSFG
eukprot:CAMPEP_0184701350 /NCGR_PEP_ID=MMETSP0313-20130426/19469_1 /TAXON_ID=2792 /ORGANISM="Porphyridium aerugineum, Strain SAG 1380-2" /LENGTH=139 /DNA_ID=CAMNT_0027161381 /DNA_START=174 /DNA_END=589 /DNA_ORIENTATION=-